MGSKSLRQLVAFSAKTSLGKAGSQDLQPQRKRCTFGLDPRNKETLSELLLSAAQRHCALEHTNLSGPLPLPFLLFYLPALHLIHRCQRNRIRGEV